jgi:hypothetical protein
MSRLVVQVTRREETSVTTTVVELGPDQPVRYRSGDRVVNEVLRLERPLPLAALVRHVLTRYGLELASAGQSDCQPCVDEEPHCVPQPCEAERGSLRA